MCVCVCAGIDDACWGGGKAHVLACTLLHDMKRNETNANPTTPVARIVFFFGLFPISVSKVPVRTSVGSMVLCQILCQILCWSGLADGQARPGLLVMVERCFEKGSCTATGWEGGRAA